MNTPGSSLAETAPLQVEDWGRTGYREARERQEALVARRIAGDIPDTLIFTEHDPVFTLGVRKGAADHLLWSEEDCRLRGIAVERTNRGGDITYHGPGQLVGYPIISLAGRRDLHAYLRLLEQVLINTAGCLGLAAARDPGKTGIWLGPRKLAAIGVASRRWVTFHGFALNVSTNLTHFQGIVPCGLAEASVTSLEAELGEPVPMDEVKAVVVREFRPLREAFLSGRRI
ncbi:MAG: lipoyl(octanoyl) transferase LipB [Puniceicoccaceae bacterium]|nr:MAG: lipoyl(octanoyl) transferase LipB [Puniceicoccaceae bacterium]